MNQEMREQIQQLDRAIGILTQQVTDIEDEINFIKSAHRHKITVERITRVPSPYQDREDLGWFGEPELIDHTESRIFYIEKTLLIDGLEGMLAAKKTELSELELRLVAV